MVHLLMILVLFNPLDHEVGEKLTAQLALALGANGQVLSGAAAAQQLEKQGIKESDFQVSPELGKQLTKQQGGIIIVRLEGRKSGGDDEVESQVWSHGRLDDHVSIAGSGHDVVEGTVRGVLEMIAPDLPDPNEVDASSDAHLPQLASNEQWQMILDQVAPFGPPSPGKSVRALYYEVMADSRLGRVAAAGEALKRMQDLYPSQLLTAAAASLMPAGSVDASSSVPSAP